MRRPFRCIAGTAILACVAACQDPTTAPRSGPLTDRAPAPPPSATDGTVIFLPPLGSGPLPHGTSDISRHVEVEICVRADTSCAGDPIARLGGDQKGTARLLIIGGARAEEEGRATYAGEWRVPFVARDGARRYRLTVTVDGRPLAHRDLLAVGLIRDLLRGAPPHTADEHLVVAGLPLPILFWIERPPQVLHVQLGAGVTGTPASGDSAWPSGSTIRYAFTAAPGYENVLVRVDGLPAAVSGTIVADTEHVLTATADRHVTVAPAALPLYDAARRLLDAPDPVAAFQDYLSRAADYASSHDAAIALRDVRDAEYVAFDPIRDSAALRRLDAALAGREFTVASSGTSSGSVVGAAARRGTVHSLDGATLPDSLEPTVFMYVNGIWTSQFGAQGATATQLALRALIAEVPRFDDRRAYELRLFYNPTYSEQRPTPEQQRAHCVAMFGAKLAFDYVGVNSFGPFLSQCMNDSTYRRFSDHDLIECVHELLSIIANTDAADAITIALGERIQEIRSAGRHVILVPHSQGNLLANAAIHRLRTVTNEYDPERDTACIGVVSLASPTSRRWDLPDHYLAPVVVRGDAVAAIDNQWPPIDTDLSHELLDHFSLQNVLALPGFILHGVIESYIEQPQSRAAIQAGLSSVLDACVVRTVSVKPTSVAMPPNTASVLLANAVNAFGDTLFGRVFTWTNSSPNVGIITHTTSFTATVRGIGQGTTTVTASNHARRFAVPVTVQSPAPPSDPFAASYVAQYPEGFFGDDQHLSGTVDHPGAVPMPAGTLRLSFVTEFGQLSAIVNGVRYAVNTILPDTVVLFGSTLAKYHLAWNLDRTSLSGTIDTQNWIFQVGWIPVTLPVSFDREEP